MRQYKAPEKDRKGEMGIRMFLAGSIEMGKARNWQKDLAGALRFKKNLIVYNPRRDDWDPTWTQSKNNPKFVEQVTWELKNILKSDIIVFYIQGDTLSPITLYELGLISILSLKGKKKIFVCCEEEYFRLGNVEIVADLFKMPMFYEYEEFEKAVVEYVNEL